MTTEFKNFVTNAFDYNETLKRQSLKHEDVQALREKAKTIPAVPRLLYDKQVSVLVLSLFVDIGQGFPDRRNKRTS